MNSSNKKKSCNEKQKEIFANRKNSLDFIVPQVIAEKMEPNCPFNDPNNLSFT